MILAKTCSMCHETKSLNEFHNRKDSKDGKYASCKECAIEISRKYYQKCKKEINKRNKIRYEETGRQKLGHLSMYENKSCAAYLGIVVAERLCRHLFKDVEVMPHNNTGFDIICNKGKKIDVKSGCITLSNRKYPRWTFDIDRNTIADFFILVAFDNRTDLNPLYLWMIPGNILNKSSSKTISPSTIHKWNQWKRDIEDAQLCCTEIKNCK